MSEEKFLTVREVAQLLGGTEKDVLNLAESGSLPAYRIGGVYLRFQKGQVMEFKKSHGSLSPRPVNAQRGTGFERVRDFLYLNDFYILAFTVIVTLLVFIFRGD